ncbi:hypothetical protein RchiOBHm_Chr3g0495401 [Rosa chinensis]|uniref:Uncharacterized protein n=1 Tax=Rosa chinensis TaxID=74649 RepID=A0A2P6RH80_ROSCH|nr:hypothetical protein RchiOBHm_Chr3g0495401 [Rosa chinensis]
MIDMMKYFREDLHRQLLSTYFKKQVDGLEMLQKIEHNTSVKGAGISL